MTHDPIVGILYMLSGELEETQDVDACILRYAEQIHGGLSGEFATVTWVAGDITAIRPEMSEEDAEEFLAMNEDTIQEMMVARGWDAIETLLPVE